jgi:hypothetical protein
VALSTRILARITATETVALDLTTARAQVVLEVEEIIPTGTANSTNDLVYQDTMSLAGAANPLDVRGALMTPCGVSAAFVEITSLFIKNKSTTSGQFISMGAGSAPITSFWGASGDILKIGPGGFLLLHNPIDGYATTAATADILNLDPGAFTIAADIVICGRSA